MGTRETFVGTRETFVGTQDAIHPPKYVPLATALLSWIKKRRSAEAAICVSRQPWSGIHNAYLVSRKGLEKVAETLPASLVEHPLIAVGVTSPNAVEAKEHSTIKRNSIYIKKTKIKNSALGTCIRSSTETQSTLTDPHWTDCVGAQTLRRRHPCPKRD